MYFLRLADSPQGFTLSSNAAILLDLLAQADICNPGLPCLRQQYVGRLDVQMHDAVVVQKAEPLDHIQRNGFPSAPSGLILGVCILMPS